MGCADVKPDGQCLLEIHNGMFGTLMVSQRCIAHTVMFFLVCLRFPTLPPQSCDADVQEPGTKGWQGNRGAFQGIIPNFCHTGESMLHQYTAHNLEMLASSLTACITHKHVVDPCSKPHTTSHRSPPRPSSILLL
jgi:hypothetical protein